MDKKILLISPQYPPPFIGGSLVYIYNLISFSKYKFEILTSYKNDVHAQVNKNHNIIHLKGIYNVIQKGDPTLLNILFSTITMIYWVFKYVRKSKYEAVILNCESFTNSILILQLKLLGMKIIPVGYAEELTIPFHSNGLKGKIKQELIKFCYPKACYHIVVCHFCQRLLDKIGVPDHNVYVIPPCLSMEKTTDQKSQLQNHHILSIGRIVERKGFHLLIDAVHALKNEFPDIHLSIVGGGPWLEKIELKITELNLQKSVTLEGKVSDEKLSSLFLNADLFVLAHFMMDNGDTEGAPTVFVEASYHGIPCIGGTDSGADTLIEHEETGYVIDCKSHLLLKEKIKTLLNDKEKAKKMGLAAIEKVLHNHKPNIMGEKLDEILDTILSTR
jgi:glycosyltransferase involved in cell wall biosynthesis